MPSSEKGPNEAQSQLDKFKEAARKLECDDDEGHFKERVSRLVKKSPERPAA